MINIFSFAPWGFDGSVVSVEADIRNGLPGMDIVGLPDTAVRESKERVRVAVRNSGYEFPAKRILINLAPAGIKKEGASFDLALALAILSQSEQIGFNGNYKKSIMILGELQLSGDIRPAKGVLSAVVASIRKNIDLIIVPEANYEEAVSVGAGNIRGISHLTEASSIINSNYKNKKSSFSNKEAKEHNWKYGDFSEIKGLRFMKRALEIAAAGMHHVFLFGPPGSGKTMAARRFCSLLPDLETDDSLDVTRIYSLAGQLPAESSIIKTPPFRSPHHSSSTEGLVGGGKNIRPGEVSLAHKGVLFLDECPEFKKSLLQGLREPLEDLKIDIARAGQAYWFPADFQLIMAANPCPCGNLGKDNAVCMCSKNEIHKYWKRIGGAIMDRIDIRIPVSPENPEILISSTEEASSRIRERVKAAIEIQNNRFKNESFKRNARITPGAISEYCSLDKNAEEIFIKAVKKLYLSSRASHSILKISRTIADLGSSEIIKKEHILEAVQHRRYGDKDYFWIRY